MIQLAFAVNLFCYFLAFDSMMKNYIKKKIYIWPVSGSCLEDKQHILGDKPKINNYK